LDRIRLVHNERQKAVYLFSSVVLDLSVDKLVKWKHMCRKTRLEQLLKAEGGKVLILNRAYLSCQKRRRFNHIESFDIVNWIRNDFEEEFKIVNLSYKYSYEGLTFLNDSGSRPRLLEYRQKSQRRPSKAMTVLSDMESIKQILEHKHGQPIVSVEWIEPQ